MSESHASRKFALECLRLRADCMQLAEDAPTPRLQRHYLDMAGVWTALAEGGPDEGFHILGPSEGYDPAG